MSSTASNLASQWRSPNDFLSVLLIIGGDIVQNALAQTTGGFLTPVCFSFGWVAYSFTALVGMIGEGRLLPPPDFPVRVFNLESGYQRENKNWIIGRLLRDNERQISKKHPLGDFALRIAIYEAQSNESPHRFRFFAPASRSIVLSALGIMAAQLAVAAIPFIRYQAWEVFLITASGTILALVAGALPQWKAEKLSARQKTRKDIALLSGNGQRDVMIILGKGRALDLEDLAAAETPRLSRPWEQFVWLSQGTRAPGNTEKGFNYESNREAILWLRLPIGFWITWLLCAAELMCWLALLVTIAGLSKYTWYLLAVGGLGMFQNAVVAAIDRTPESRDIPLQFLECIVARKVMDGLMDLEVAYSGFGRYLLYEFFPGRLHEDEDRWWRFNSRQDYENRRKQDRSRGISRSRMPDFKHPSEFKDPGKVPLEGPNATDTVEGNQSYQLLGGPKAADDRRKFYSVDMKGKAQADRLTSLTEQAVPQKPASQESLEGRQQAEIITRPITLGESNTAQGSGVFGFRKEQTEQAAESSEEGSRLQPLSNLSYPRLESPEWYR